MKIKKNLSKIEEKGRKHFFFVAVTISACYVMRGDYALFCLDSICVDEEVVIITFWLILAVLLYKYSLSLNRDSVENVQD